jgi:Zn-finger nucleic acid-binding protein
MPPSTFPIFPSLLADTLSSMETSAYREGATRCSACAQQMQEQPIDGEMVDVCEACGGVWIDPSDGDIGDIATKVRVPETATEQDPDSSIARTCPRCATRLASLTVKDVELFRCGTCRGTFVPRVMLDAAMWIHAEDETPPETALDGLRGWVKYLLGR